VLYVSPGLGREIIRGLQRTTLFIETMAMTIARNARHARLGILLVGAIFSLSVHSVLVVPVLRAQKLDTMNVMRVRLDTVTVSPNDGDIFVNAYYTFHLPKPHDIRGFDLRFFYDSTLTRLQPFLLDGTASSSLTDASNPAPPEARFVVLGSNEIDLTNPVLFKLHFTVARLQDSELLRWDRAFSEIASWQVNRWGLDTIILEDGWIRVQQPKVTVSISNPSLTVKADSSLNVPIVVSDLSAAKLRKVRVGFVFDTTALKFVAVSSTEPGVSAGPVVVKADTLSVDLTSVQPMLGADTLVTLTFRAVDRTDTLTTGFMDGVFTALNADALVGSVQWTFHPIRIEGRRPASVVTVSDAEAPYVEVFPNPASGWVRVRMTDKNEDNPFCITIFDALGNEVFRTTGRDAEWMPPPGTANGSFEAIVTNTRTGASWVRSVLLLR